MNNTVYTMSQIEAMIESNKNSDNALKSYFNTKTLGIEARFGEIDNVDRFMTALLQYSDTSMERIYSQLIEVVVHKSYADAAMNRFAVMFK